MVKQKKMSGRERRQLIETSVSERQRVFKELLMHLRGGYSLTSFGPLSEHTISLYMERFPGEFCVEDIQDAQREGFTMWEQIGKRQAEGTCMGNSRTWYYNMSNRYGWSDKQKIEQDVSGSVAVNVISYARARD